MGRSAILGEQRNNYFCDVACGKAQCGDSTYAITRSGLLCEFNNRRLLDKWVELRVSPISLISGFLINVVFLDYECELYSRWRAVYLRRVRRRNRSMFRSFDLKVYNHFTEDALLRSGRLFRIDNTVSRRTLLNKLISHELWLLFFRHMSSPPPDSKYPDTIAITYDETSNKLTCIYNDHSIYVWDVHNIKRVRLSLEKIRNFYLNSVQ